MTIAIAVQVHDGIALAADSASTLTITKQGGSTEIVNVYNNANKLFNLSKGLPIGGLTYGAGNIGFSSISTLIKDLRRRFSGLDPLYPEWKLNEASYTIEDVARRTRQFLFEEHYAPQNGTKTPGFNLGFMVAGYSAGAQLSEVWSIEVVDGQCAEPALTIAQGNADMSAGGDPEVFSRLVLGHGTKLPEALIKGGVAPEKVSGVIGDLQREMYLPLLEAPMPIQDAIELAEFMVETTATFTRFKRGAATVGGPIESAAITKHEGFKWVHRKHYFNEVLNPRAEP